MRMSSVFGAAALSVLIGQGALAQNLPAEFPPPSFEGTQYVDSNGCVFVRAGISGMVNWVPRLTRDRVPLCGFAPSLAAAAPAPAAAPITADVPVIVPEPAAVAAVEPPARPAEAAPMETVASITTAPARMAPAPAPIIPQAVAAPTPQVIAAPEPVAAPEPRRITLAQACEGRTGIQPNMILSRTGQPVDCGPGPQVAAVAVAAPAPARLATACTSAADAYFAAGTGVPVRCGPQAESPSGGAFAPLMIAAPAGPAAPAGIAAPRAPGLLAPAAVTVASTGQTLTMAEICAGAAAGTQYVTRNGLEVRCGPQEISPSGAAPRGMNGGTGYGLQGGVVARGAVAPALESLFGPAAIPASNPVNAPAVVAPPPGFETVWNDVVTYDGRYEMRP